MTANALYKEVKAALAAAGKPDAGYEAGLLLAAHGLERFSDGEVPSQAEAAMKSLAARRAAGEPLQYLLGTWPFMGLELFVGPGVLVPRADTECVCEAAIAALQDIDAPVVLDLCSGTGALALGIAAARPVAQVTAVELYSDAYTYLERNIEAFAKTHPNAPRAVQADALAYHQSLAPVSLDLLVCNPPYVTPAEYEELEQELYHEPKTALVAGEEGHAFYRAIAQDYKNALKPGASLVFEIGATQGEAVTAILAQNGYTGIKTLPDLAGNSRIAIAKRPAIAAKNA